MATKLAIVGAGLMLALSAAPGSPASAAATIVSQVPCAIAVGSYCTYFLPSTNPIPVIRSIKFNAPSAGNASVSFHGTLYCANNAGEGNSRVVDVVSQIVDRSGRVPDVNGPSGLRHAIVLVGMTKGTSDTFSLASTRNFAIVGPGIQTYYFKMQQLRMDADTKCYVFNATFTVIFIP
jgi:hypothetical protein